MKDRMAMETDRHLQILPQTVKVQGWVGDLARENAKDRDNRLDISGPDHNETERLLSNWVKL